MMKYLCSLLTLQDHSEGRYHSNVLLESLFLNAGFCIFILSNQKNMIVYSHLVCCQSLHPEYPKLISFHNLLCANATDMNFLCSYVYLHMRYEVLTVVNMKTVIFWGLWCHVIWQIVPNISKASKMCPIDSTTSHSRKWPLPYVSS